jgi:hypothetical protein
VFRSTAEGETGHAHGHLEFLEAVGDPATGLPIGETSQNLSAAVAGETHEYTDMYPGIPRENAEQHNWFRSRLGRARALLHSKGCGADPYLVFGPSASGFGLNLVGCAITLSDHEQKLRLPPGSSDPVFSVARETLTAVSPSIIPLGMSEMGHRG